MNDQWINGDSKIYGIINISVANLRLQPVYQSELINQLILGTIVPIFEEQNDFYYIQNWDGYFGWINKHTVVVGDKKMAENWYNSSRVMVMRNYGVVRSEMKDEAEVTTDLVPCAILKRLDSNSTFTKVELPDGQTGFVETDIVIDEKTQLSVKATREGIVNIAKKFLGIPYLWGGTSTKGFDCSGFVQTVFRLHNIKLYRDASQVADMGQEILVDKNFGNLEIGDLIFFGKTLKRITHVAISLGNDLFIHSQASVRISSLNSDHQLYDEYRHKTFLKAVRIL
jgi:SH3-like domain-containing protein